MKSDAAVRADLWHLLKFAFDLMLCTTLLQENYSPSAAKHPLTKAESSLSFIASFSF